MNNMKKTLLILLSAASIALAGCGNSAGMSKDSATAEDITAVENTAESSGDANDSSILMADATVSYLGPAGTYTEEAAMFCFP